jgi:hypothetical protein
MAKAALRCGMYELTTGIFMNAVDTGWFDEDPAELAKETRFRRFSTAT